MSMKNQCNQKNQRNQRFKNPGNPENPGSDNQHTDQDLWNGIHRSIRLRLPALPQSSLFALPEHGQDSVRISRLAEAC